VTPSTATDVATLTGAATLGLGRRHAALYSTSDELADALVAAGDAAGERLWRMPLVDDYRESLESTVADVAHIETRKMGGGSITALYVERFAREVPWAHRDIAGPGRADADEHEVVKGGTAFGTRALLYWLETAAAPK
jgi:leucyl aminopeptidase